MSEPSLNDDIIKNAIIDELQKGTPIVDLAEELIENIRHNPRLNEELQIKFPEHSQVLAKYNEGKKYVRELQCGFCEVIYRFNLRLGIPKLCPSCKRSSKEFKWDAPKMATWLMEVYQFAYIREMDKLYYYTDEKGIWSEYAEELIRAELYDVSHDDMTVHVANEVVASIKAGRAMGLDIFAGATRQLNDDLLINLLNGIYSVKQRKLLPYDAGLHFLKQIPIRYDATAVPERICKFFWDVSKPHWDRCLSLYEYAAWLFMPENNFQKMALFWGEGSNGKDVVHYVYRSLVGDENSASINLYQLTNNRFAKARLFGKLLNTAGEVDYNKPLENTGVIKELRGESPMSVENKGKTPFDMKWTGKAFFNANKFPKTTDDTTGFYRTWQIQKFENVFDEAHKNVDTHLKTKLSNEMELAGLFNWIVEGFLPLLMEREGFTFTQTAEEIADLYKRKSDSGRVFIDMRVVADSKGLISKADMRSSYEKFCEEENLMLESDKGFRQALDASGLPYGERQIEGQRYWKGIRLKTAEEVIPNEMPAYIKIPADLQEFMQLYMKMQSDSLSTNIINSINNISTIVRKYNSIMYIDSIEENSVNPVNHVIPDSKTIPESTTSSGDLTPPPSGSPLNVNNAEIAKSTGSSLSYNHKTAEAVHKKAVEWWKSQPNKTGDYRDFLKILPDSESNYGVRCINYMHRIAGDLLETQSNVFRLVKETLYESSADAKNGE